MITDVARRWSSGLVTPLARALAALGLTPSALTILGLVFNLGVAVVLARGDAYFGWAAALILLAGFFDTLDGAVARLTGQVTLFGAFLDSTVDRYSEATLYLGLLYWYVSTTPPHTLEPLLIYLTIVGSLLVSYTRARAEGLGVEMKEGLFTRLERIIVLVVGLAMTRFFDQIMLVTLLILAVGTNLTAVQRLLYARGRLVDHS